ncbi:MAG: metalloregulator ArsR/SmtB family transcription factor [Moritella sp.]|uniref:metalloregulator ArsR/SmtB family transcription factor n=1 Tax=Moritella sp. TaxID=78556 RepID=UPI0029A8ACC3|nr:metalloregulator ArsR/SmtB family transcription factor [Moritella sp.]MDX2320066.1 metalloregulator ArsR/SmtB family transcription factor [Moritella sp.]
MVSITSLQLFKNLSDETRLNIILLIREVNELCVCELCSALNEPQTKISRNLSMLKKSGLLIDRKEGKWVHYRMSPHIPAWASKIIDQAWESQRNETLTIANKLSLESPSARRTVCN